MRAVRGVNIVGQDNRGVNTVVSFGALTPAASWYLSIGWKIKDAEPSDAALFMNRLGVILDVILGLVILVSSCSIAGGGTGYKNDFQKRLLSTCYESWDVRKLGL